MLKTYFNGNLISLGVALALASPVLSAQESEGKDDSNGFVEQIIVTGTASGRSVRKVEASSATTLISAEDISRLAPKSTAELFVAIPGVWAESSGGVSGANVFVRGLPGGGDAPFLTVQLQGVPVYSPPTLSFLENSTLFRVDETIEYVDALRGGASTVVSNGQPGLTTNFRLKEGSDETEGLVKYSTSDYGLQRVDAVVSGALAEDLYFMVGGYVQQSSGVRDAGFNSEKGQQITINITKELDNGTLNLYSRITDDHGAWYLPTPLVEGVDNSYTQLGTLNRQASINYGPNGEQKEAFDFGEGRGWDGAVSGGSIELELGDGWYFVDRFGYTSGDADTLGLVPNGDPVMLASVADNGSSATGAVTGTEYNGSSLVQQIGRWVVRKQIESFTNDLAITKEGEDYEVSVGLYKSDFSANDWWSLGNHAYHLVQAGGEMLTGIDCNDNNLEGCGWNYDINSAGDGSTTALYAALEYSLNERVKIDLGLRRENHEIEYTVDEGLDGVITKAVQYDESDTAFTAGLNWQFEKDAGMFVRYSEGSKMPYFDDFRDNFGAFTNGSDLIIDVEQLEVGYKIAKDNYYLYATGFATNSGSFQVTVPGQPGVAFENESLGVELDAAYFTDDGFSVTLNATIQDTEISKHPDLDVVGNDAPRQPGWQLRVTPAYDFEVGNYFATAYSTLTMVDDRYADLGNTVVLDGYEKLDLGLIISGDSGLSFEFSIQNLTDEDALSEGDPRNPTAPNGRFILPRTASFNVTYAF